ncbi:MAG TPA: hypothetical protein VG225_13655 [Terracidiphilus sp.]|jgi:hypothetical protein|nr:hypothetical protein [Terracidiphilus sp.]
MLFEDYFFVAPAEHSSEQVLGKTMSRLGMLLSVILLFSAPAGAQPQPRPKSIPPIEPLLRSNEPRLIALGAWEVIRRPDDSQINLLVDLAERWDPAQRHRRENNDAYDAMTVVLDALIQRKATPSPAAALAVAHAFPDQALILASRLRPEDAEPILLQWYQEGHGLNRARFERDGESRLLLSRVAAMFLARDYPDLVAASLLADTRAELAVSVTDPGSAGVDRCFFECDPPPPCRRETVDEGQNGWPPVFTYSLEENDPFIERRSGMLIYAGADTITWRRVPAEVYQDDCFIPRPLTPVTRYRLLADMLHVRTTAIPWAPQMNLTLPWTADQRFLQDLAEQVGAEEARLRSTVQAFFDKGLLTRSQLATIRPRLSVVLFDDRQSQVPVRTPLPILTVQDARTVCRLARLP